MNRNLRQFGIFARDLSIDESMVPYYGRHDVLFGWLPVPTWYLKYTGRDDTRTALLGESNVLKFANLFEEPKPKKQYKIISTIFSLRTPLFVVLHRWEFAQQEPRFDLIGQTVAPWTRKLWKAEIEVLMSTALTVKYWCVLGKIAPPCYSQTSIHSNQSANACVIHSKTARKFWSINKCCVGIQQGHIWQTTRSFSAHHKG